MYPTSHDGVANTVFLEKIFIANPQHSKEFVEVLTLRRQDLRAILLQARKSIQAARVNSVDHHSRPLLVPPRPRPHSNLNARCLDNG